MPYSKYLRAYSGQTAAQLLSMEGEYRIDSLLRAFEQAVKQKISREGADALTPEERTIVAVEALEREVNNGGFLQFFQKPTREFAPFMVNALLRLGCPLTAAISQRALDALALPNLSAEAIDAAIRPFSDTHRESERLDECDGSFYQVGEDLLGSLFAFIKANLAAINL